MISRFYILLFLAFSLTSCNSIGFDTQQDLVEFLNKPENGYLQNKHVQGYDFSLMYKPTDLLVYQELGDSLDLNKLSSLRKKYDEYLYFRLSISKNNQEILNALANDKDKFGAMLNQLMFDMDRKVHLFTEKKDTIAMTDFIHPRTYGVSPSTNILFVFPKKKALEAKTLSFTIEDLGFYTGEIKFNISTEKIKNQPKINFE